MNVFDDRKIMIVKQGVSKEISVPWWIIDPEIEIKRQELLSSQFFLLRQGEIGEVFRCKRCHAKHMYFTLMCVERPFDGLKEGLAAYFQHAGRNGAEMYLSTIEYQRYEAIRDVLNRPDLANSHPGMARALGTGANEYDIGAVSLGLLEPITKAKASALVWNINARGLKPPFVLKGLERG